MVYYFDKFCKKILEASDSKDIKKCLDEWVVIPDSPESDICNKCICGHDIIYPNTIKNKINGHIIKNVGSECIKKFSKDNKESDLMNTYRMNSRVHCDVCNEYVVNQDVYKKHILTKKHIDNIEPRKCLDCKKRIKKEEKSYVVRCYNCYRINKKQERLSLYGF